MAFNALEYAERQLGKKGKKKFDALAYAESALATKDVRAAKKQAPTVSIAPSSQDTTSLGLPPIDYTAMPDSRRTQLMPPGTRGFVEPSLADVTLLGKGLVTGTARAAAGLVRGVDIYRSAEKYEPPPADPRLLRGPRSAMTPLQAETALMQRHDPEGARAHAESVIAQNTERQEAYAKGYKERAVEREQRVVSATEWLKSLPPERWQKEVEVAAQGPMWGDLKAANTWLATVGQQIPIMAAAMAGHAIGALAAGPAGGLAGGFAPMALVEATDFHDAASQLELDPKIIKKYAKAYGAASGAIEYAQMLWIGKAFKPGTKALTGKALTLVKKALKELGGMAWEGVEELSQNTLSNWLLQKAVGEHNELYGTDIKAPELGEGGLRAFTTGFGVSGFLRLPGHAISTRGGEQPAQAVPQEPDFTTPQAAPPTAPGAVQAAPIEGRGAIDIAPGTVAPQVGSEFAPPQMTPEEAVLELAMQREAEMKAKQAPEAAPTPEAAVGALHEVSERGFSNYTAAKKGKGEILIGTPGMVLEGPRSKKALPNVLGTEDFGIFVGDLPASEAGKIRIADGEVTGITINRNIDLDKQGLAVLVGHELAHAERVLKGRPVEGGAEAGAPFEVSAMKAGKFIGEGQPAQKPDTKIAPAEKGKVEVSWRVPHKSRRHLPDIGSPEQPVTFDSKTWFRKDGRWYLKRGQTGFRAISTVREHVEVDRHYKESQPAKKRIVSEEAYQKAKKELSSPQVSGGLVPGMQLVKPAAIYVAYHIENGARTLAEVAKLIAADFRKLGMAVGSWPDVTDIYIRLAAGETVGDVTLDAETRALLKTSKADKGAWGKEVTQKATPKTLAEVFGKSAEVEKPATNKQKAKAHILASEQDIAEEEYRKIAEEVTGKRSMADMTKGEAAALIDRLTPKREAPKPLGLSILEQVVLRKVSGSDEVYAKVQEYARQLGGIPENESLRKAYLKNLSLAARKMKRFGKKVAKGTAKGKEIGLIHPLSSARYTMGEAELKAGVPLRATYTGIVFKSTAASQAANKILNDRLKKLGKFKLALSIRQKQNDMISDWLFEEDAKARDSVWAEMDEKTREVANVLRDILQNESANAIREARWRIWDRVQRRIRAKVAALKEEEQSEERDRHIAALEHQVDQVRPPNAPKGVLAKGRQAKKQGKLAEWIATQEWGTRRHYYMSEAQLAGLVDTMMKSGMPESLAETPTKVGGAPLVSPEGVKTREGKAKRLRGRSAITAVLHHLERAMVANATADSLEVFWANFEKALPSKQDIGYMREFMDSALGRPKHAPWAIKKVRWVTRAFWRFYFVQPTKAIWFATRNLIQNVAFGPSQLTPRELAISAAQLVAGQKNSQMAADFANEWSSKVSQRRQMHRQFLLQEEGEIFSSTGAKAVVLLDALGQAAPLSDEVNRLAIWPLIHQAAYRWGQKFAAGKISYGKLAARLKLDTLHISQQLELQSLLDKGDTAEFVRLVANWKTENVHFRYETAFRSAAEQTTTGRAIIGLLTYPRGVFELTYQNSVKPLAQGIRTGDGRKIWQGVVSLALLYIGAELAKEIVKKITGKTAYGFLELLTHYTPFDPGASKIAEFASKISQIQWRAEQGNLSIRKTADNIAAALMQELELFLVFSDAYLNYYEAANDKRGVRLWSLLKKEALAKYVKDNGRPFKNTNRDFIEKIQHVVYGGHEKTPVVKEAAPARRKRKVPRSRRSR